MKASEIRDLSHDERIRKLNELKEGLFNLRFQHGIGQLETPNKMMVNKREIARIKTIVREYELTKKDKE
ncbi:large ribosomal subunit protein uL29 [Desulfobacterium sp. N47]|uniref:Large ribosomal subunit protein uL29 n=1 Tax=uncultured Desulfobacterium sp. TaxID=201089 RepID=E1YG81_9BACT|nr:50S ribosomal protein L29 [uncultured Desulfobacterium sp.]